MMKHKRLETLQSEHQKKDRRMKYVRVTDKITILVPRYIPDDEAREEYLLKLSERDRQRLPKRTGFENE